MSIFIIMIGIPFSGKSTWAKHKAREIKAEIIDIDNIQARSVDEALSIGRRTAREFLRAGKDVIFDAPNVLASECQDLVNIARHTGSSVKAVFMSTEVGWCLHRRKILISRGVSTPYTEDIILKFSELLKIGILKIFSSVSEMKVYSGIWIRVIKGSASSDPNLVYPDQLTPENIFSCLKKKGVHWLVDYTNAPEYQIDEWLPMDIWHRSQWSEISDHLYSFRGEVYGCVKELIKAMEAFGYNFNYI